MASWGLHGGEWVWAPDQSLSHPWQLTALLHLEDLQKGV